MNYQVFARKWRPKKFADLLGQQDVITAIMHSFKLNRIHHAYILYGTRGIGKTTVARLFAKGLNCDKGLLYDMCGECKNCKDIDAGCFVDLIEIDAAYYTKVDDIRDFLDNIYYAPSYGRFKVYLIDEVHMLSRYSFNALLKILEEPPEHVKFILVTTEYHKLPKTIVSRCLQFYLKPLSVSQIVTKLVYICDIEQIVVEENVLKLLAYEAKGSMRDALNLLEQAILLSNNNNINIDIVNNMLGILHIEQSLLLIENLIDGNVDKLMNQIDGYSELGINWDALFKEVLTVFQKIAITQFSSNFFKKQIDQNHLSHISYRIYNLSNSITPENVQLYYQIFLLSRRELSYAPSYRAGMEMAVLRALAFLPANINSDNNQDNLNNFSVDNRKNFQSKMMSKNIINNKNIPNINNVNDTQLSSIDVAYKNVNSSKIECTDRFNSIDMNSDFSCKSIKKIPDFTAKILDMRSKLIKSQQHFNQENNTNIKLHSNVLSKKISENILDKFSNIHLNNTNLNKIKKK